MVVLLVTSVVTAIGTVVFINHHDGEEIRFPNGRTATTRLGDTEGALLATGLVACLVGGILAICALVNLAGDWYDRPQWQRPW